MSKKNPVPRPVNPRQPELICIDGSKGYVPGNVVVVSRAAAKLLEFCAKWSLTPEQLRKSADWMERHPNAAY